MRGRASARPPRRGASEPVPEHPAAGAEDEPVRVRRRDLVKVDEKGREARDVEAGRARVEKRTSVSSSESEGPESPKMGLWTAVAVLLASTGLACKLLLTALGVTRRVLIVHVDLTAEALTDSLEAIGEVSVHTLATVFALMAYIVSEFDRLALLARSGWVSSFWRCTSLIDLFSSSRGADGARLLIA